MAASSHTAYDHLDQLATLEYEYGVILIIIGLNFIELLYLTELTVWNRKYVGWNAAVVDTEEPTDLNAVADMVAKDGCVLYSIICSLSSNKYIQIDFISLGPEEDLLNFSTSTIVNGLI
jgi:hypothetical protein